MTSVAVAGHYAYTTAYSAGRLTAVDISNPAVPVVTGQSAVANSLLNGTNITIAGGYAYVISKNRNASTSSNDDGTGNSLTVLDIGSNPAQPAIVGSVHDSNHLFGGYGVAVSGHYVYVAAQGLLTGQPTAPDSSAGSFDVIDVSNPANPTIVASIDNGSTPAPWTGKNLFQHATSVAASGNYAYVTAFYSARLTVIDISNPLSPKIVTSLGDWTNLAYPADVAVAGGYAYVANQTAASSGRMQFALVDVSNPAKPRVAGALNSSTINGAYRIRARGGFAYVAANSTATVAAIDASNPASPRLAGSLTDTAHLHSTTGLDLDATGQYVIANSPTVTGQTSPTYPPYPGQSGGPTITGTISAINLDPTPIAVTIAPASAPANPTTQTSASFTFTTSNPVATVQCRLDGAPLGLCTSPGSQQYSGLAVGSHTFTVRATDAAGNTASDSYTWTVGSAPLNTSLPTVSGPATQGQVLTGTNGAWSGVPTPSYTYQWLQCDSGGANCSPISGATSSTYTLQAGDVGSTLELAVTATNGIGSSWATSANSAPTAVVSAATSAPANTAPPAITGSAVEGQTLTASTGTWTGTPAPWFSYQWLRCDAAGANCSAISGATASLYTALAADVGSTLEVTVTGTNTVSSSAATSSVTATLASAPGPVTPLLDDFNGANNSGPPSASWSQMPLFSAGASSNLFISNQQMAAPTGNAAAYWNPSKFSPDSEVWVTVATKPAGDLEPVVLGLREQNPGTTTVTGYLGYFINRTAATDQYKITLRTNGAQGATLASSTGPELNAGDKLLFRVIGTSLELWRWSAGMWTRILTATDSSIPSAGYISLWTRNTAVRLDDFGGGTLP